MLTTALTILAFMALLSLVFSAPFAFGTLALVVLLEQLEEYIDCKYSA